MTKIKKKKCFFCLGHFTTYKNFDYCRNCAINGNRYIVRGKFARSGMIKFPSSHRPGKIGALTKPTMRIIKSKKKNTKIYDSDKNLSFWEQVDEKAHYLIADILNQKLPLANCRDKKIFNPNDDADYRSLLLECEDDYGDNLPELEKVSEEIAYEYLFLVAKSLVGSLRNFAVHKEEYLKKLF